MMVTVNDRIQDCRCQLIRIYQKALAKSLARAAPTEEELRWRADAIVAIGELEKERNHATA